MKKSLLGKVVVGLGVLLGIGGVALASTDQAEASTLYRAYNPNTGEHLYTQNSNEIPSVVRAGWRSEGTAWEAPSKGTPVYRMFNPNRRGDHHYTINTNEVNMLKTKGWRYEGVSWQSGGSTPVYRLYNPNARSGAHHFTTLASEKNNLVSKGWRYEGVAFYSGKDATPTPAPTPNPEKWVFIAWFEPNDKQDIAYQIKRGDKVFNTQNEATNWINNYTKDVLINHDVSGQWGTMQVKLSDLK